MTPLLGLYRMQALFHMFSVHLPRSLVELPGLEARPKLTLVS